jgi:DNA polymerase (family X)
LLSVIEVGSFPLLVELRSRFPESILDLFQISGLGPKKIKILFKELKISSIEQLHLVCEDGSLALVKGFGEKTVANLQVEIDRYLKNSKFWRYDQAEKEAEKLSLLMQREFPNCKVLITGELRRRCSIVSCLELLVVDVAKADLLGFVSNKIGSKEVKSSNEQISFLSLKNKKHVFWVSCQESVIKDLFVSTGPAEHVSEVENYAKELGAKTFSKEEEIYKLASVWYVPPELRDVRGAVTLEQEGDCGFLGLVEQADIKGVLHVHSNYSDGNASIENLAMHAISLGYQYLGISDHSKTAIYANGLSIDSVKKQHEEIDKLNEKLAPFVVFKGIESDILKNGELDYPDNVLESFDFVIASIHSQMNLSLDEQMARLKMALENPYTTILGHPSARLLLKRDGICIDMEQIVELAAKNKKAVEINSNPRRLDLDWRYHQQAQKLGVMLPICPDAHSLVGFKDVRYGVYAARKGGVLAKNIPNTWDIQQVSKWLLL